VTLKADEKKLRTIEKATLMDMKLVRTRALIPRLLLLARRQLFDYYFTNPPLWKILRRAKSREERMIPAFASIGAVRSGTSLLSDYILQHPCVVLPITKEIAISRAPKKRLLMAHFPTVEEGKAVESRYGTAMTGYCTPVVPHAAFPFIVKELAERLKLVVILRNPADRTYSHWRWDMELRTRRGMAKDPLFRSFPDFPETVRVELEAIRSGGGGLPTISGPGGGGYVQHSIYLPFLENLFRFYDKEEALFLDSDDFFEDPIGVAKRVYAFLGLPEYEPLETPVKNAGPKTPVDPATREELVEFFRPRNQELYDFIGEDFGWS